jgi:peptidoglycan hydrolase-like protein with peptidoglycan-binding domain
MYLRPHGRLPSGTSPDKEHDMTTTSLAPWPVIAQPMEGPVVEALQHLLHAHGHSLAVDGIFGPETAGAVEAFQQSNGLVVDALAGPETWTAIIITVQQGSEGDAVRAAQTLLVDVTVDGIFGPLTDAGVRFMQDTLGVPIDGIVGPLTWRALVNNGC